MKENVFIVTERIIIREYRSEDLYQVHKYASDPEVVRYMEWGPNQIKDTEIFIDNAIQNQRNKERKEYTLAVVLKKNNKIIGGCGINVSSPANLEGWVGYCFNKDYWGKGYGTETAKALVEFGFSKLNLHRIYATCDPENIGSSKILEKIGMKKEGHLRQNKWQKGKWRDSSLYAILEHEWEN